MSQQNKQQDKVVEYLARLPGPNKVIIETALSHLFLIGDRVYKLKKAVNAGYVDLTQLKTRRECCIAEIELNSRYAAQIYHGIVSVVAIPDSFELIDGECADAIEYLVLMNRFDADSLLSQRVKNDLVTTDEMRQLARKIASFHNDNHYEGSLGTPEMTVNVIKTTLNVCQQVLANTQLEGRFVAVASALKSMLELATPALAQRQNCIVFGHGDLHSKNVCCLNDEYVPFDGIDFSQELACIDRLADVAFLFIDLIRRKHPALAYAFLNEYLEITHDYENLDVFLCFCVHRALIRALVCWREEKYDDAEQYLNVAEYFSCRRDGYIVAVGGLSGTGKTTLNRHLSQVFGGIQLRSDVVRKILLHLSNVENAGAEGYNTQVNIDTYNLMVQLADAILANGFPVFIDATFRLEADRLLVEALAHGRKVKFIGFWCQVPFEIAAGRINSRMNGSNGDASDADVSIRIQQEQTNCGNISWLTIDTSLPIEDFAPSVISEVNKLLKYSFQ